MTEELNRTKSPEGRFDNVSLWSAAGCVAMSAYTLFRPPAHRAYHRIMEEYSRETPQPLQPSIGLVTEKVAAIVDAYGSQRVRRELPLSETMMHAAHMVQFVDHFPQQQQANHYGVSYEVMQQVKQGFQEVATEQQQPLDYAQQLEVVLKQTDGDVEKALETLFLVSRQYARWLDSTGIVGVPLLSDEEIICEMQEWRKAVAACKSVQEGEFQDPSGDTYYAWTHALSRYLLADSKTLHGRASAAAFMRGTDLMHTVVHSVSRQSVPNDHRRAAIYGNAIGDAVRSRV